MQPVSGWVAARITRVEVKRHVSRVSDDLLEEFGPIDLADEVPPRGEQQWRLAADLDYLQSCIAGTLFWKLNHEGRFCRSNALNDIRSLLRDAKALNLPRTAERLEGIASALRAVR